MRSTKKFHFKIDAPTAQPENPLLCFHQKAFSPLLEQEIFDSIVLISQALGVAMGLTLEFAFHCLVEPAAAGVQAIVQLRKRRHLLASIDQGKGEQDNKG